MSSRSLPILAFRSLQLVGISGLDSQRLAKADALVRESLVHRVDGCGWFNSHLFAAHVQDARPRIEYWNFALRFLADE
jgi:hypothetical protein